MSQSVRDVPVTTVMMIMMMTVAVVGSGRKEMIAQAELTLCMSACVL